MPCKCVVGLQWGDEAKARVVDMMGENADIVVRFQGGSNAGHTVVVGDQKYVFHLVPSGIIRGGKICVIGNGVVVDPELLIKEINELKGRGIDIGANLLVSDRAHAVMPYHKRLDAAAEQAKSGRKIGTTLRGIGPCYRDKIGRSGIRMAELINPATLEVVLRDQLEAANAVLVDLYGVEPLDFDAELQTHNELGALIKPYVTDTACYLNDALAAGKDVLFEGAQGALLDIDFGTYPYVTSSNATVLGVCAGAGVPPKRIGHVVGVMKAYTTRVGLGPFPTELDNEVGQALRDKGHEYGATTGRPRRCGWLDLVALRYTCMLNGVDAITMTKLDVLSGQKTIKFCTSYNAGGQKVDRFPAELGLLEKCRPVYDEMPGWDEEVGGVRKFGDLPAAARNYVNRIRELLGVPIPTISVGHERSQVIQLD